MENRESVVCVGCVIKKSDYPELAAVQCEVCDTIYTLDSFVDYHATIYCCGNRAFVENCVNC